MSYNYYYDPSLLHQPVEDQEAVYTVPWIPTVGDAWKLNFAAVINDDFNLPTAGVGAVIRDQNAVFKAAFAAPVDGSHGKLLELQMQALSLGLHEASKLGVEYLAVEGDSVLGMSLLRGYLEPSTAMMRYYLEQCISYLASFRYVSVNWVRESVNRVARKLSVEGMLSEEAQEWIESPPLSISQLLVEDVIGCWLPLD